MARLYYARYIPQEGQIVVLFGNWYNDLLATAMHMFKPFDETLFDAYVQNMRVFETDLKNNNVDVVKFWFEFALENFAKTN